MATYVNIRISQKGENDPGIRGPSQAVGPMGDARSVSDSSPLQVFVRAKKKINDIFKEIEGYVRDAVTYMQSVRQDGIILKSDDAVQVEGYVAKVRAIQNVLIRNHMKVALFGRTSNGKSSVINAMLGKEILPSGIGHTTNCFVQVEGSNSGESYLVKEGSNEKQNVKSVGQLANALCKEKLGESQLVHIYWPKDKCLLLRHDVVFVDSPGSDMSRNLDKWIGKYCQDADVFIFVANAESTITQGEKDFFHEVSMRVSKPNIFILNNRWDASASVPHLLDQVRAQHMERAVEFLVKELKVCSQKEANQRIFFVSAKEALQARLQEEKGLPAHSGALADGFPNRYYEFQDFERKFEESISKSAVKTKFEQHSQRGKLIVSEIRRIVENTNNQAQQLKEQKAVAKKEIYDKLKFTEEQLSLLTQEMEDKIQRMVIYVEQMVSKALSEEIDFMSVLVDRFNWPFNSKQLDEYKEQLHHHVENGLVRNLHAVVYAELANNIENSQREMTERMSGLLPAEKKQVLLNGLPRREPFKILYRLNCDNLFTDFHEDLSYRNTGLSDMARDMKMVSICASGKQRDSLLKTAILLDWQHENEKSKWNNEAKERAFKQQSVAHAKKKLRPIVNSASANCSKQVEQELSSTLAQLHRLVTACTTGMDAKIKTLNKEIKQLEEAANSAKVLQNKANYITKQLEIFDDAFLKLRN